MKKSKFSFATPLLTAIAMVVGLLLGNLFTPSIENQPSMGQSRYQKIQDIIQILDRKYVDEVNSEEIFEKASADMLHNLDPHSNYIPAKDLQAITSRSKVSSEAWEFDFSSFEIRSVLQMSSKIHHRCEQGWQQEIRS